MDYNYRGSRQRELRRRARRRRAIRNRIIVTVILVIVLAGVIFAAIHFLGGSNDEDQVVFPSGSASSTEGSESAGSEGSGGEVSDADSALAQAERLAASYDYDGAIALLQEVPDYESNTAITDAIAGYEEIKATLVEVDITQVPHIFFHSLIVDTDLAFGSSMADNYNQVMTTISEFDKILEQMYENGYVLVSLHDMAYEVDGQLVKGSIMLPADKKPFVLSVDDVSYYEYMDGHGFATKLIIAEDGTITNEMEMEDGSIQTGAFDVVPRLDAFVEEHPDFSYQGAKGIVALTGYDGILGYRTAPKYGDPSDENYKEEYASLDVEEEREQATAVAARMKEMGWEFASHSWGHRDMGEATLENMKEDMEKWLDQVNPLLGGDTDILIFPKGTDIGSWRSYDDNEKYDYLKSVGFDYYCNVDSNQPWVQFTSQYLRQGRINADGYEMYYHADKLNMFFDVDSVFDSARPTPVPEM